MQVPGPKTPSSKMQSSKLKTQNRKVPVIISTTLTSSGVQSMGHATFHSKLKWNLKTSSCKCDRQAISNLLMSSTLFLFPHSFTLETDIADLTWFTSH